MARESKELDLDGMESKTVARVRSVITSAVISIRILRIEQATRSTHSASLRRAEASVNNGQIRDFMGKRPKTPMMAASSRNCFNNLGNDGDAEANLGHGFKNMPSRVEILAEIFLR